MTRYGIINGKTKREIVLLKGGACKWGRCSFCDYTGDNTEDAEEARRVNEAALARVTGKTGRLEAVNSGSVFELHEDTINMIKDVVSKKAIHTLFFESAWMYRDRLDKLRKDFLPVNLVLKCGIETFDEHFRNNVLNKGIFFKSPAEVAERFDSVCLLAGVKGQTKAMIERDIEILLTHFNMGCINIFNENSTNIKADYELISWFKDIYGHMDAYPGIDVLWENTDFGVGEGEDNGQKAAD